MTILRAIGLLSLTAAFTACGSSPLPSGDIPSDFYFFYRMERAFPGPSAPVAESGAPAKAAPAKPAAEKPAKPTKPTKPEKPAKPAIPKPVMLQIEIEANGKVEYEVHHKTPRPSEKKGELTLGEADLRKIYEAIRDADLFDLENRYTGEDEALGKETWYVMGRNRYSKEVIVQGTTIPSLATLRTRLLDILPAREIFTPSPMASSGFILDLRSGKFHRSKCPQCSQIPPTSQQRLQRVEYALNETGSYPCEECRPLESR